MSRCMSTEVGKNEIKLLNWFICFNFRDGEQGKKLFTYFFLFSISLTMCNIVILIARCWRNVNASIMKRLALKYIDCLVGRNLCVFFHISIESHDCCAEISCGAFIKFNFFVCWLCLITYLNVRCRRLRWMLFLFDETFRELIVCALIHWHLKHSWKLFS